MYTYGMKSRVLLSFLVVFSFVITSCVPRSHLKKSYDQGKKDGSAYCSKAIAAKDAYIDKLNKDLADKNARLNRFNQLNPDNTLRTKSNDSRLKENLAVKEKPVSGQETWQK